ncbi:MAG: peptidylprolyl isomerase [Candidatus Omnitrophica bacterium]|nr:peptidylprolyl isomerase [Candidatus Omnitrophota bacterium]
MRRNIIFIAFSAILLFGLCGCDMVSGLLPKKTAVKEEKAQAAPPVKGPIVAKINNIPVTLEDLNQEIDAFNAAIPDNKPEAKINTREKKLDYLKNELVRRILLYQYASDKGLDKNPEVQRALEKTKQDLLVIELIREEAANVDVSSKEIEDYYNTYKEQLREPEERQIREIVVSAEPEAKDIMIQLLQGADFATLARERSKAASAKEGGDLGFIQRGTKSPQFDAVAFSDTLDVGKVSNIFKGPDGYYIIKLEAKSGGKQRSLSELWDDIKRGLIFVKQQKKIEDLIGRLSRDARIEIYEGEIK